MKVGTHMLESTTLRCIEKSIENIHVFGRKIGNPNIRPKIVLGKQQINNPAHCGLVPSSGHNRMWGLKMKPPSFDCSDASSWILRVQYYFDRIMLLEDHRLHYVMMLFDPPVAKWVFNYRANNTFASWPAFPEDVHKCFDQKIFVNHMGLIAKYCQMETLADYNREFECMWNRLRLRGIPDYILLPVYIEGLQKPVKNHV